MSNKRTSMRERRGMDAIFETPSSTKLENDNSEVNQTGENLLKLTVLIPDYQVAGIEQIQVNERRKTGKKPDKYKLAKEAFDLLLQKYGITETH